MERLTSRIARSFVAIATGVLCLCMASLGFAQGKVFDHGQTGFDLIGGHSVLACESCHIGGQFESTPRECSGCHAQNGRFNATFKPINHIMVGEQCDACHTTTLWEDMARVDHDQVFGSCLSCHNGLVAPGQPPQGHVRTGTQSCSDCHSNLSWQPAVVSHANVVGECIDCHNNFEAIGKPANHITATDNCEACHNENAPSFGGNGNYLVDHDFVIGACVNCHASDKPVNHIPLEVEDCGACHNPAIPFSFRPANVDHSVLSENCRGCHEIGLGGATTQPSDHPDDFGLQCSSCHKSTQTFLAF